MAFSCLGVRLCVLRVPKWIHEPDENWMIHAGIKPILRTLRSCGDIYQYITIYTTIPKNKRPHHFRKHDVARCTVRQILEPRRSRLCLLFFSHLELLSEATGSKRNSETSEFSPCQKAKRAENDECCVINQQEKTKTAKQQQEPHVKYNLRRECYLQKVLIDTSFGGFLKSACETECRGKMSSALIGSRGEEWRSDTKVAQTFNKRGVW